MNHRIQILKSLESVTKALVLARPVRATHITYKTRDQVMTGPQSHTKRIICQNTRRAVMHQTLQ